MSKIKISTVDGAIKIESITVIDQASVNKLNNPVNTDRIHNHLKDIRAEHEIVVDKNGVAESHLFRIVCTIDEHDIKVIKSQHSSFLEHVYNMPEIEVNLVAAPDDQKIKEQEEKLKGAAEFLKTLNEDCEGEDFIYIGVKLVGPFLGAVASISIELLKEMVDCYIDKHINNG